MTTIDVLRTLEDRPLLDAAKRLAGEERRATAALLRALMEIDSRRLYLGEGCASMFAYCTQVLHLAEGGAYNRIEAARAARDYPLILQLFEQSAITLTAVRLLAPHLTANNHAAVLASAQHRSKREVEEIVAALRPKPDAPAVVRRLPGPLRHLPDAGIARAATRTPSTAATPEPSTGAEPVAQLSGQVRGEPPPAIAPLAAERYRIQMTVSRETHDRFRRAQSLLRHAVPSGDAAEIFDRAITLLVERLERQRFASTPRPRNSRPSAEHSRHIPAGVRRTVWQRDGGRCAFAGTVGRCRESTFLEFHHVEPFCVGGEATVDNIQLRCRAHNAFEARLFHGHGVVREADGQWASS